MRCDAAAFANGARSINQEAPASAPIPRIAMLEE